MNEEVKEESQIEAETRSASYCKGSCTAKKVLFGLGGLALIGGIVWLALACPSCH